MSTTTLINGNGAYTSAPAKSEDSQYPMTNLQTNDVYSLWRSASALAGTFYLDFDLGADVNVDVVGFYGFRRAAGQAAPNAIDVMYRYAADTYTGVAGGAWKYAAQAIALPGRHAGVQLPGVIRARYWRFVIGVGATGGGFTLGLPYLGLATDLGFPYAPGAESQYIDPTMESALAGAIPVAGVTCDSYFVLSIPFESVSNTLKDTLRAIAVDLKAAPAILFDPFDNTYPVSLLERRHSHRHMWHTGDGLWDSGLSVRTLP